MIIDVYIHHVDEGYTTVTSVDFDILFKAPVYLNTYTGALKYFTIIIFVQECFNSPYGCEYFKEYAEPVPVETGQPGPEAGQSCRALSQVAKECGIFLVGGGLIIN